MKVYAVLKHEYDMGWVEEVFREEVAAKDFVDRMREEQASYAWSWSEHELIEGEE